MTDDRTVKVITEELLKHRVRRPTRSRDRKGEQRARNILKIWDADTQAEAEELLKDPTIREDWHLAKAFMKMGMFMPNNGFRFIEAAVDIAEESLDLAAARSQDREAFEALLKERQAALAAYKATQDDRYREYDVEVDFLDGSGGERKRASAV